MRATGQPASRTLTAVFASRGISRTSDVADVTLGTKLRRVPTDPDNPVSPAPPEAVRGRRVLVLSTAAVVLVLKLWVAATTFGTNDVRY